jgi:hypothetical protein
MEAFAFDGCLRANLLSGSESVLRHGRLYASFVDQDLLLQTARPTVLDRAGRGRHVTP